MIIHTADNGYYMGDWDFAGKWPLYEQSLRVPQLVHDPRLSKAKRRAVLDEMALNIDIPATMLQLAGIEIPTQYQGHSLSPLLQGKHVSSWRNDFFCEHLLENPDIPKWEGVRGERYVYARYFEQEPIYEFLHNLEADPDQLVNLAGDTKYRKIHAARSKRCDELMNKYGNTEPANSLVKH